MKKPAIIILIILFLLVIGVLLIRFFGEENAWVCENGQWIKHGNPSLPMPSYPCQKEIEGKRIFESAEEEINQAVFEKSKQIAQQAVENSPTYKYDGFDLKFESFEALSCPSCWEFVFSFQSRHSGYGDRKGQILSQIITPHKIRVTVDQEKITSVVTDQTFDELNQKFLK